MQTQRVTVELVELAEQLVDRVRAVARSDAVSTRDLRAIDRLANDVYLLAQVNDAHIAHVAAVARTGPVSKRARETRREVERSLELMRARPRTGNAPEPWQRSGREIEEGTLVSRG